MAMLLPRHEFGTKSDNNDTCVKQFPETQYIIRLVFDAPPVKEDYSFIQPEDKCNSNLLSSDHYMLCVWAFFDIFNPRGFPLDQRIIFGLVTYFGDSIIDMCLTDISKIYQNVHWLASCRSENDTKMAFTYDRPLYSYSHIDRCMSSRIRITSSPHLYGFSSFRWMFEYDPYRPNQTEWYHH